MFHARLRSVHRSISLALLATPLLISAGCDRDDASNDRDTRKSSETSFSAASLLSAKPAHGKTTLRFANFGLPAKQKQGRHNRPAGKALQFRKIDIFDPGIGTNAFAMLVPTGWKTKGGVVWAPQEAQMTYLQWKAYNPDGSEQIEFFKNKLFYWQPPNTWVVRFRNGSNYLGMEVQPTVNDPKTFVTRYFLPRNRRGYRARITGYEEMPKFAKAARKMFTDGVPRKIRSGRVRLEYRLDGQAMQEDVYVTLASARSPFDRRVEMWGPVTLVSYRAEKGKLDTKTPVFNAIFSSAMMYHRWHAGVQYVQQLRTQGQLQAIYDAGRLSRIISQNNDDILRIMNSTYRNRQRSYDRVYRNFSNYIRGVDDYRNPYSGYTVQLPNTHRYVWAGRNGRYLLSNNALFNPNVSGNGTWTLMNPVR